MKRFAAGRAPGFIGGFLAVPRAVGLMFRRPRLLGLAALPAGLSLLLFLIFLAVSFGYADDLVNLVWQISADSEGWVHVLVRILHALTAILVFLVLAILSVLFAFLASLVIVEPFLDMLSESTDTILGTACEEAGLSLRRLLHDMGTALYDVSMDLGLLLAIQGPLLLLLLVPVLGGILNVVVGGVVATFFAGLEVMSVALGRRGCHGLQRWRLLLRHKTTVWGVGSGACILFLVPLAQLLTLPVAVVAGTLAVNKLETGHIDKTQADT